MREIRLAVHIHPRHADYGAHPAPRIARSDARNQERG